MHSVTCGIRSLFHQKAVPASTVRVLTAVTTFYFCANMLVLKRRMGVVRGRARARKQLQKRGV